MAIQPLRRLGAQLAQLEVVGEELGRRGGDAEVGERDLGWWCCCCCWSLVVLGGVGRRRGGFEGVGAYERRDGADCRGEGGCGEGGEEGGAEAGFAEGVGAFEGAGLWWVLVVVSGSQAM